MRVFQSTALSGGLALAIVVGAATGAAFAQQAPQPSGAAPAAEAGSAKAKAGAAKPATTKTAVAAKSDGKSRNKSIVAFVNDEPVTAYEVDQRAAFLALSSGGGDLKSKAEARWKQIAKDPKTNERFQQLLREKNVQTREEAQKLQTQFVKDLQHNMIEQLKREARSSAVSSNKAKAQEELISEKLKLQEAKAMSVVASEDEVDRFIANIAERNKMTPAQFAQHMKGMGVDISTMRSRFLAELSWRDVIRRRFGHLISVTDRDVDRIVANTQGGEDDVELQLRRISVFAPQKDQKQLAKRMSEAQELATHFSGCDGMAKLATEIGGGRFEDLGYRRPSDVPEPTRSMLLNTQDNVMLPPSVGQNGIELWAVCGRKVVTANEQKREMAESELRQEEFEIHARKYLNDVRDRATIEYR